MRYPVAPSILSLVVFFVSPSAWAIDEIKVPEVAQAQTTVVEPENDQSTIHDTLALGPQISSKTDVTSEDTAEKASRKACKIEICDVIATREPIGENITCDIKKTWRADSITRMLGDQFSWPWGKAVCQSKLNLSRADLAAAMLEANTTIKMDKFTVSCELHTGESTPYVVEMDLAPTVTFRRGKAISATVNWGDISAPLAIYPILYAGTGLDNRSNLLGSEVVTIVNEFTDKKCAAVKGELPGRRMN